MRIAGQSTLAIAMQLSILAIAAPVVAQISSGPAALLVFPRVLVDVSREIDTIVQLGNTSDEPVEVRCLYEDDGSVCVGTGACFPDASTCDGFCQIQWTTLPFRVRLTPNQPLGWSVARGLYEPPLDGTVLSGPDGSSNAGTLVPAVSSPFDGSMHCVVVDDRGRPSERNVLVGTVSIETDADAEPPPIDATQHVDAARYNAFGLGGQQPEYAACPTLLVLPHIFDGAAVRTGDLASTVFTTLSLLPCAGNLLAAPPAEVVQALVRNEFAQRFSTSRPFEGSLALQLSLFDTTQPNRSIFHVGVAGTLTGQTDLQGIPGGLLGVALEAHEGRALVGGGVAGGTAAAQYHAAVPLGGEGVRAAPAVLAMLRPPCHGDCNGDGMVLLNELVLGVGIGLDTTPVDACRAADGDDSRSVRIDEILRAVQVALTACPAPKVPTTPIEPQATPTPTLPPPSAPGPDITFLGIASAADVPQHAVGTDSDGRPIFTWPEGQGLSLIVEARPGTNRSPVGR
jgi:hypothetical protein